MKRTNLKRSFLLSVLSLLLCVSMFVGTTFAWFSETISNQNNRIMAGNLDVELYYKLNAGDAWTELTSTSELFDDEALWEPGYTQVVYFKVENKGTLALKYQLGVNIISETEGTNVAGDPFKLSDYIEFGVIETADETTYATRELARAAVTSSKIISEGFTKSSELLASDGTTPSDEFVTMVVYMPETVENEANYKTGTTPPQINLGIELYATQMMNEEDAFGPDYDEDAKLPASKTESVVAGSDTVINTENGSVTVPAGATTVEKLTFSIAPTTAPGTITVAAGETLTAYEVELLDENGDKVTTTAPVEATIFVGKNLIVTKLYHNDQEIDFNYDPTTGYVTFKTTSFSPFTVVTKDAADLEVITTVDALVAAAANGGAYKLGADLVLADPLAVEKTLTLLGEGHTLTYTGTNRAITVEAAANGAGLTLKDLTVDCTASYCQRGINYNTNGTLVLDGVTVKGTSVTYAVNLPISSNDASVSIIGSSITGNIALNVWGKNATVNAVDTAFTTIDNNDAENYSTVSLNNNGTDAAEGTVITITGGSITAGGDSLAYSNLTYTGEINVSSTTTVVGEVKIHVAVVLYEGASEFYACYTLQEAIDKAAETPDTATVKLIKDITMSEILVINAPITLDGNGKTLTSTAARAINVSGANGVVIKDLIINASGERAVNVIQNATNVVLDNVTATAANYAVNVATSAPNAVLTIKNSTINGLNAVNVASAGTNVTITDSTINCNDANTTAGESYAALCLNKAAVGGSIIATNTTVNVTAGSDSEKGRNGAEDGTVIINGSTEGVTVTVAVITYPGSDYYYGFKTLAEAIEFAKAGDTITLIRDIVLTETVEIPAGKTVTLDLNGKTVTAPAGAICAIKNEGTLTVKGDGTITGSYSALYSTGNLTVESGNFTATDGWGLLVDNIYGTVASVAEINGGTFTGVGIYNPTEVTINGGTFNVGRDPDGASDHISDEMTLFISPTFDGVPNTATVTLNGGTFNGDVYVYDDGITETVFVNNGATINGDVLDNA